MGSNKDFNTSQNVKLKYSYTIALTPSAYTPKPQSSSLKKRSSEDVKRSRCSAYEYLIR